MELEIKGSGADLQKVLVLIFYQIPRNNAGQAPCPFSNGSDIFGHSIIICRKESFITDFRNINKGSLEWIKLSLFTFV